MKNILVLAQENFLKSKLYERIGYIRKYRRMTQAQMAEKCITTEKCVNNWELGKSFPIKRNRKVIAAVLGVKEELIFGTPEEYKF